MDAVIGGFPKLAPEEYEAVLKECSEPLPSQLSNASAVKFLPVTESEEGGFLLVSVDQSTQQESKFEVVRDNRTGVLTVEVEGSVFVLAVESSTKEVKQVKRAVKRSFGDHTAYFTVDDFGKLSSVFQDRFGEIKFAPIGAPVS